MAVRWDADKARALYDQDMSFGLIAKAVGVQKDQIYKYGLRHWPRRACDTAREEQFFHAKDPTRVEQPKRLKPGASTLPPLGSLE